jgi:N-acetylglutamate synthase-like GNAT family acetyltransferase
MLPRSKEQILGNIDSYVVAARRGGPVVACAALEEFSPSLAEVACVAVSRSEHGNGLGSLVVLGVEQLARARQIEELFAMSLSDRFFLSLGYNVVSIARYPEKLARYEKLMAEGVQIVPKRCFQKLLTEASVLAPEASPEVESMPSRKLRVG